VSAVRAGAATARQAVADEGRLAIGGHRNEQSRSRRATTSPFNLRSEVTRVAAPPQVEVNVRLRTDDCETAELDPGCGGFAAYAAVAEHPGTMARVLVAVMILLGGPPVMAAIRVRARGATAR
jgi:hypothetical protein